MKFKGILLFVIKYLVVASSDETIASENVKLEIFQFVYKLYKCIIIYNMYRHCLDYWLYSQTHTEKNMVFFFYSYKRFCSLMNLLQGLIFNSLADDKKKKLAAFYFIHEICGQLIFFLSA